MENYNRILPSAADTIGSTPLVELSRLVDGFEGRLLVKLEMFSPGHSKKDRIARQIIEDAERDGEIRPGQTVVEHTSGNTGTGLAIVCSTKGYPFVAVLSRGNSEERVRMMEALGAEVVVVDQGPGAMPGRVSGADFALVEDETLRLVKERDGFHVDQFNRQGSFDAHYLGTGPELVEQSGGQIDAFCDFVGSGGTFGGTSKALREAIPGVRCYAVEPENAAVMAGGETKATGHRIQGGGYSRTDLKFAKPTSADGFVAVSDEEAMDAARRLASEEGIFAGFSSGANVAAALKLLEGVERGQTIATIINDSGLKYLSTDLWEPAK